MQEIKLLRVVTADILGAVIAQEVVELVERLGDVGVAHTIDDVDVFPGVEMVHAQVILSERSRLRGYDWAGGSAGDEGQKVMNSELNLKADPAAVRRVATITTNAIRVFSRISAFVESYCE